jgi:hypothetical protein
LPRETAGLIPFQLISGLIFIENVDTGGRTGNFIWRGQGFNVLGYINNFWNLALGKDPVFSQGERIIVIIGCDSTP